MYAETSMTPTRATISTLRLEKKRCSRMRIAAGDGAQREQHQQTQERNGHELAVSRAGHIRQK